MKKGDKKEDLTSSGTLADVAIVVRKFHAVSSLFTGISSTLSDRQKQDQINQILCDLIKKESSPAFLLPAVIDFIDQVNAHKILDSYSFFNFELWLNQFSHLSTEENYQIRAKIAGKFVPRDEYQVLFPIAMGKTYPGSHYVTAHGSPDLDTTIASFWGWVDAFAARVSENLHIWNLPGGPPLSLVEISLLFQDVFGPSVFDHLAKGRTSLSLSGLDLINQTGVVRKETHFSTLSIDHGRAENAIVLVDPEGCYLGDWRNFDAEEVRQVIMLLNNCLRWFENHLHVKLISFFGKQNLSLDDLPEFIQSVFSIRIEECDPSKEFTLKQRSHLQDYLVKVLDVKNGLECTFEGFAQAMKDLSIFDFKEFVDLIESLHASSLFDATGRLIENRSNIFAHLEKIIKGLERAIQSVRSFVDRLDVALKIKTHVFGHQPQSISYRTEVEEIRSKMGSYSYLTVTAPEKDGKLTPLGVIHAKDLYKPILGTVSLRDFCNRDETKIPSYLEVISVIDHHKSALQTFSAPMVQISDSQSSNVLCAQIAFVINDRHSTGGMSPSQIKAQLAVVEKDLSSMSQKRIMQRLLQRSLVAEQKSAFFVDPTREHVEYIHFLYAILDDTDLLMKVSWRDIECIASLLNRLKSLKLNQEVEVIVLDDLPRDKNFASHAAKRILQNPDMHLLYRKIYLAKEMAIEESFKRCAKGQPSSVFIDTKEQNGCVRIGQTKLFSLNHPFFQEFEGQLRKKWYQDAIDFFKDHKEVDLHMHMISTVAGAEELYKGIEGEYAHLDELWLWIPFEEQSIEHLKSFLNAFRASPQLKNNPLTVEFHGDQGKEYEQIFNESFLPNISKVFVKDAKRSVAILKYKAGSINSRKAMIAPYLPHLS